MRLVRFWLAVLLAGLAGAQAGATPQEAMPLVTEEVAAEFLAVGRINAAGFDTRRNCTGALIRPDVVLTAAHCAADRPERIVPTDDDIDRKLFVAGYDRAANAGFRRVVQELRHPAYGIGRDHDPRFDVALLFLDTPITDVPPLPLAADAQADVALVGYHRFVPHALTGRLDCPVRRRQKQLLWIDCPVFSGNSGGPVLERDAAGAWQVTGVVSSRTGQGGAIATRLPQWVFDTLEAR